MRNPKEIIICGQNLVDILTEKMYLKYDQNNSTAYINKSIDPRIGLGFADLNHVVLRNFDLSYADMVGINLNHSDLRHANLEGANLSGADLSDVNFSDVNLNRANLDGANLEGSYLADANLNLTNLHNAKLRNADLSGANLEGANLSGADLTYVDFSGAKGLLNPAEWLSKNFEHDDLGYIVYKAIGETFYPAPDTWNIKPGEFIEEVVNPLPTLGCACGINFATLDWIKETFDGECVDVWRCRIRWQDLPGVVVPYNTNGKARCNRLELLD